MLHVRNNIIAMPLKFSRLVISVRWTVESVWRKLHKYKEKDPYRDRLVDQLASNRVPCPQIGWPDHVYLRINNQKYVKSSKMNVKKCSRFYLEL